MPALHLSNLFRRNAACSSLGQRAAGLKASLSQVRARPASMPKPGSEEAMAAFHAACHEHTIRTQFANEYSNLKRTPLEWWTSDSLSTAMETGGITPAECARLYPLATERELRMREIEHELNLGALHALAFADSYPVPSGEDDADETEEDVSKDTGLIQLGHLFKAARLKEVAACEACNAAGREADRLAPHRPAVLTLSSSDHPLRVYQWHTHPLSLEGIELRAGDIEWLRSRMPMKHEVLRPIRDGERAHIDHPGHRFDIVAHPNAQARAEEIITAWDTWQAEKSRIYKEHLTQELEDAADEAGDLTLHLATQIASLPARTAEGFRVKLRALVHYRQDALLAKLPSEPDPDQILSHSLWRDMQGNLLEAPPAQEPNLVSLIDLSSASMRDLQALHDMAQSLGDVAGAFAWTARCHTRGWSTYNAPGDGHNVAGHLAQWLGDALSNVQHAANEEAKRRTPTTSEDQETRWEIIARPVLENGDPAEIATFARDLRDYAGRHSGNTPADPILALIAESLRVEEDAADLEARWQSIPPAERAGREDAMSDRQEKALDAVLKTKPTTHEGLKAFADYVGYQASLTYGSDWRAKGKQEMSGNLLVALCAAVETAPDA